MLSHRLLRFMAFILLVASVLSTEAVEAWRRDLADTIALHQTSQILAVRRLGLTCHTMPHCLPQGWANAAQESRPNHAAIDDDEDFVDIPTFSAPDTARPDLAPHWMTVPAHFVRWSEPVSVEAPAFLPDSRGPPPAPSFAPTGLRAPPPS